MLKGLSIINSATATFDGSLILHTPAQGGSDFKRFFNPLIREMDHCYWLLHNGEWMWNIPHEWTGTTGLVAQVDLPRSRIHELFHGHLVAKGAEHRSPNAGFYELDGVFANALMKDHAARVRDDAQQVLIAFDKSKPHDEMLAYFGCRYVAPEKWPAKFRRPKRVQALIEDFADYVFINWDGILWNVFGHEPDEIARVKANLSQYKTVRCADIGEFELSRYEGALP